MADFTDVFGKPISDGTNNELDLASHYQYSPERWRVYRDGSRQFPEYNSVTGFTDEEDLYVLSPAQGETLAMETTERPRYTVQYELWYTFALSLSRQLESGDRLRVGPYDQNDGWFFEKNDTHDVEDVDLCQMRNGTIQYRESGHFSQAITRFTRLSVRTPWYDVGRQIWGQSYGSQGRQSNHDVGRTAYSEKGPRTGNLPVRYEIQRGASSSPLDLNVGSVGVITLGATQGITRIKEFVKNINVDQTGTWIPLFAMRNDPDSDIINIQLQNVDGLKFTGNSDVELMARAFAPEHVADSGGNQLIDSDFGTPDEVHAQNSAIQTTEAVDQVVDNTGTLQSSMPVPGGYQIGFSTLTTDKKTTGAPSTSGAKQTISPRDIVVFMAEAGATGNLKWNTVLEEDW